METLYELNNPIKEDLAIVYKGMEFKVVGLGELKNIPEEVMIFWSNTHQFLKFKKQSPLSKGSIEANKKIQEEIIEEIKEEEKVIEDETPIIEEIKEEVVEVATKTKVKK